MDGYESKDVESFESQSTSDDERSDENSEEAEENWDEIKPLKLSFAESDAKTAGPSKSKAVEVDETRGKGDDEVEQAPKVQEAKSDEVELSVQ